MFRRVGRLAARALELPPVAPATPAAGSPHDGGYGSSTAAAATNIPTTEPPPLPTAPPGTWRGWGEFAPQSALLRDPDVARNLDGAQRAWQRALEAGHAECASHTSLEMVAELLCHLSCNPPLGVVGDGGESRVDAIFRRTAPIARERVPGASPRVLGLLLWGYTVGAPEASAHKTALFDAIFDEVLLRVRDFAPPELVDVLMAFSLFCTPLRDPREPRRPPPAWQSAASLARAQKLTALFHAFEEQCLPHIDTLTTSELLYCITAYVNTETTSPAVFAAVARCLAERVAAGDCAPRDVPSIALSMSTIAEATPVLDAIAAVAIPILPELAVAELASLAIVFSMQGHDGNGILYAGVAEEAIAKGLATLPPDSLTHLTYALASNGYSEEAFYDAVAAAALGRVDAFTTYELAHFMTAHVMAEHMSTELFSEVLADVLKRADQFEAANLTLVLCAFASLEYDAPELFDHAAGTIRSRLPSFVAADVNIVVWAYCKTGHATPELLGDIAHHVSSRLPQFSPQELSNMVRWYSFAGYPAPEHWPTGYWTQKDGNFPRDEDC